MSVVGSYEENSYRLLVEANDTHGTYQAHYLLNMMRADWRRKDKIS